MTDLRDPLQFNDAYRRLSPLALAAANRVLRDEAAAEDVVQDVFMHLWLRPGVVRPRPRHADELRDDARPLPRGRPLAHPHARASPRSSAPPTRPACTRRPRERRRAGHPP